jgi:hypothetical protein
MPVQKKISELTAKTGAVEATDLLVISDYNGVDYDSKKVSISQVIPYKSFIGVHNQTGTGAPTITGGYSQLTGTLTFARTSAGTYTITNSVAEFLANKTFVFNQWGTGALGSTFQYSVTSTTVITFYTWDNTSTLADSLLAGASLEIKIIN